MRSRESRAPQGSERRFSVKMFGTRLKTWMENYIGRPKKKAQSEPFKGKPAKAHAGGLIMNSSESLTHSDTGISSGSHQVLSSSIADHREGYSTATTDSDRTALIHCHTAVSLPSPESAYSTGYSTDGTSPGATAPPEYYINIRTGKHYFPSPAPTPTSPHHPTLFPNSNPHPHHPPCPTHSPHAPPSRPPAPHRTPASTPTPTPHPPPNPHTHTHTHPTLHSPRLRPPPPQHSPPKKTSPKPHYIPTLKLFLRSPRDPSKPKKWFKQPFHKLANRRADICPDAAPSLHLPKRPPDPPPRPPSRDAPAASPRQRNRIKTNPWLPTLPASPHNPRPTLPLPPPPRNRSATNTPLHHRHSTRLQPLHPPPTLPRPPLFDSPDRSDEDITLNEMMGTYNESYVYEKETDILSDSDPTDCDDYATDSDADNAGDERDSHDDELDFIDNASLTDSDDAFPPNTGRCTYHHPHSDGHPFLHNPDRRHSRSLRRAHEAKARRERRRQGSRRWPKCDDDGGNRPADEGLRRVVLERVMARAARGGCVGGARGRPLPGALLDEEADHRYRELMQEADHMFQTLTNSPLARNKSGNGLLLTLPVASAGKLAPDPAPSAHSPLDPLGPALRHLAVFRPPSPRLPDDDSAPDSPRVPIAFQSVVLGKPLASYCPQSEPVKRKVYSCSKTYDRLVKHLDHGPPPSPVGKDSSGRCGAQRNIYCR